jgi:hypothetical protein
VVLIALWILDCVLFDHCKWYQSERRLIEVLVIARKQYIMDKNSVSNCLLEHDPCLPP